MHVPHGVRRGPSRCFFFSSRRRHTRLQGDWSSDVCSSDLCKAVMPESTFARIYQEMINFCKWHGNFDPKTMGTVPNVGLMAQKAEEYGSHDKTFEIEEDGVANIVDLATGEGLMSPNVEQGDN